MHHSRSVLKSKSSNTAMSSKEVDPNKKTWSSAKVRNTANTNANAKKRGVYVVKQDTVAPAELTQGPTGAIKDVSRLRRGGPTLDPESAKPGMSTQFPEPSKLTPKPPRRIIRKLNVQTVDKGSQDLDALAQSASNSPVRAQPVKQPFSKLPRPLQRPNIQPRKRLTRSQAVLDNIKDKLVVLQPKMDRSSNPSSVFSLDTRRTDKSELVKVEKQDNTKKEKETDNGEQITPITKESKTSKRLLTIEEPSRTLVSDYAEKNRSLYNLFVDLLETTFNVYNVQSDVKRPESAKLGIDEKIADKLNITKPQTEIRNPNDEKQIKFIDSKNNNNINKPKVFNNNRMFLNNKQFVNNDNRNLHYKIHMNNVKSKYERQQKKFTCIVDDGVTDRIQVYNTVPPWRPSASFTSPTARVPRKLVSAPYRTNLKSQSFNNAHRQKQQLISNQNKTDQTVNISRRKRKKNDLLNIFKKELMQDCELLDEPQTMYGALAKLVDARKRMRRAIRFDESTIASNRSTVVSWDTETGKKECFKRRDLISKSGRRKQRNRRVSFARPIRTLPKKYSTLVIPYKGNQTEDFQETPSRVPSIEVTSYNVDLDQLQFQQHQDSNNKAFFYTYDSADSLGAESIGTSKDLEEQPVADRSPAAADSDTTSTNLSELLPKDLRGF